MKKKIIAIAIATMMAAPAMAQIFIDDDQPNNRANREEEFGVMVLSQDVEYDQWKYAPVGEGLFLLAGLAGAYLIGKRRKEE